MTPQTSENLSLNMMISKEELYTFMESSFEKGNLANFLTGYFGRQIKKEERSVANES